MAFTKITEDLNIIAALSDEPNVDDSLTAAQLKAKFDSAPNKIKTAFNNLIDALMDAREGFEASNSISAGKIYSTDESDGDVQSKLEHLKTLIDNTVTGDIPDGTITSQKLNANFRNTLATNTEMGVLYLASKYNECTNTGEIQQGYQVPQLTSESHTGYTISCTYLGSSVSDLYTMIRGNGEDSINTEASVYQTPLSVILECDKYIKFTQISFSCIHAGQGKIYGSIDGTNYELITEYVHDSEEKESTTVSINKNKFYKYIKITQRSASSSRAVSRLYNNINIIGYSINSLNGANILSLTTSGDAKLTTYQTNQVIKIKTPSNYVAGSNINSTLNINNIGAKNLPIDLEPSTRYALVYDGTSFIKEA